MNIIRVLTPEEVAAEVPAAALAAWSAPMTDVFYCHVCDGLRLKKHECVEWHPGATEWAKKNKLAPFNQP